MPDDANCLLPIFGQDDSSPGETANTWYIGKAVLSSYYTIFDASHLEQTDGYLQIGMGEINPSDQIGADIIHHDKKKKDDNNPDETSGSNTVGIALGILFPVLIICGILIWWCKCR